MTCALAQCVQLAVAFTDAILLFCRISDSNFTHARRIGAARPAVVERLLQDRRRFEAVVLSDADTVWLRHVRPLLVARPTADVFVATDCLSHQVRPAGGKSFMQSLTLRLCAC